MMSRTISAWTGRAFLITVLSLSSLCVSDCFAQHNGPIFKHGRYAQQPFQSVGRFLGAGYGAGYHRCNPGPDSSYYNPYSAHNSYLVSQSPEYLARYGNQGNFQYNMSNGYGNMSNGYGNMNQGGIPYPVYSGTAGGQFPVQSVPGQTINADFEPVRKDASETRRREDEDEDDSEDNDFRADDDDFGSDGDDQPSVSDESDPGEFGDFEEEASTEDDDQSSYSDSSIFFPASHGK